MMKYRVTLDDGRAVTVEAHDEGEARAFVMDNLDSLPSVETLKQQKSRQERSALRPAGIMSRGLLEGAFSGVGALGSLPLDVAYNIYAGLSSDADMGMPFTRGVARTASRAADMAGLPDAETRGERLSKSFSSGVGAALSGGPLAGGAISAGGRAMGSKIAQGAGRTMAAEPFTQALAGGVGGVTTQTADEMGLHPALGAAAGMVAGAGAAAGRSGVTAAHQMAKPFYGGGKRDIIGNLMRDAASDPAAAAANLDNVPTYVRGSNPTTAAAARDAGLNSLSKGVERMSPQAKAAFDERVWDNNAARNRALDRIVPTEGHQQALHDARQTFADQATSRLFDNPEADADPRRAFSALQALRKSQFGQKRAVRTAAGIAENELDKVSLGDRSYDVTGPGGGRPAKPGALYSARQNIADLLEGDEQFTRVRASDGATTDLRAARKGMLPVLNEIDDAIEAAAPGYRSFMKEYSQRSAEIERGDILRKAREGMTSRQSADPKHGEPTLMLSGIKRTIDSIRTSKDFDKLNTTQQTVLKRIAKDLDREQAAVRSVASAGSDTVQNLTTNAFIQRMLGNRAGGSLPRQVALPLQWLYKVPERQMQDLLLEAMLDPAVGRKLLQKASPQAARDVSNELRRILAAMQSSARVSAGLAAGLAEQ